MSYSFSRNLSTVRFAQIINESNMNGERFCFILGSGASVESGIPSGSMLEMQWMNCLMGEKDDRGTSKMDPDETRRIVDTLYREELITHNFDTLVSAWKESVKTGKSIPSEYYFDIYKLRFFPNQRNGYSYLEKIMDTCAPSAGYHVLAKLLTNNNLNNLVITTNFDSLVEDALFIYTEKRPLVVGHESLAEYMEANIQRPMIAKVHRGLLYAPFNSPETTDRLKDEWQKALHYAFNIYTPIVIGYAGGDHSLMDFLEDESTNIHNGVYWCYHKDSGFPEERIQNFVSSKQGCFVETNGFDSLMLAIGMEMFEEAISPASVEKYLDQKNEKRIHLYNQQWIDLDSHPHIKEIIQPLNDVELQAEKDREEHKSLTAMDYYRRARRAESENDFEKAIQEYSNAIDASPNYAIAYYNRGRLYHKISSYDKALEDYEKAIEIEPTNVTAYIGRSGTNKALNRHFDALQDCEKAIEIDPNNAMIYVTRGSIYSSQNQHPRALEDYARAIALNPNIASAYNNRGVSYSSLNLCNQAMQDYDKAIQLSPDYAKAYSNRGKLYVRLKKYKDAETDCDTAIRIDPCCAEFYRNRAELYRCTGRKELAEKDECTANRLEAKTSNCLRRQNSK